MPWNILICLDAKVSCYATSCDLGKVTTNTQGKNSISQHVTNPIPAEAAETTVFVSSKFILITNKKMYKIKCRK